MAGSIRNFEKLLFSPKSRLNVLLEVKLPNTTDWHSSNGEVLKSSDYRYGSDND